MTAVHTGDAFGFPAGGHTVGINGQGSSCVVDGKITEIHLSKG
ncbi:hypothetical protein [Streptomyces sp. bgisy034]